MNAALEPEQQLIAAYAYFVLGVTQQDLAVIFNVNGGRVNEACKAVGSMLGLTTPGYKQDQSP